MGNGTAIRDPKIRRARALRMIEQRILGLSLTQVGKLFNLEGKTVMRELTWAEKEGLLEDLERSILKDLVPVAITTIKHTMEANKDSAVALEVMKGVGLFRKPAERQVALPSVSENEESLEVHVRRINRPASQQDLPPGRPPTAQLSSISATAASNAQTIEAEVVDDRDEAREANPNQSMDLTDLSSEPTLEQHLAQAGHEIGPTD